MDIAPPPNRFAEELSDEDLQLILREARIEVVERARRAKLALDEQIQRELITARALVAKLFA
jgi:hypothetical protein